MVFQCINIRQVPRELLKTAAFGLGFQHLLRDLANVNAWKTMFDPYILMQLQITNMFGPHRGLYIIHETRQWNINNHNHKHCDDTKRRAQWQPQARTQENHK